jgi:hypothetical protein
MNKDTAKRYIHLIQALAEGKTIQHKLTNQFDFSDVQWIDDLNPDWSLKLDNYRVKPDIKKGWYRVAVLTQEDGCSSVGIADNEARENMFEREDYFVRWITERIEYEIP